jgi:hypothetical protein
MEVAAPIPSAIVTIVTAANAARRRSSRRTKAMTWRAASMIATPRVRWAAQEWLFR